MTVGPQATATLAFRPIGRDGLAVYRADRGQQVLFYAPGYLCVASRERAEVVEGTLWAPGRMGPEALVSDRQTPLAELLRHAERAEERARRWREGPFRPESLTLYPNNECNLRCTYCHSDPGRAGPTPRGRTVRQPAVRLDTESVVAAGRLVAQSCREKDHPFYLVFHGGGEPALERDRVDRALHLLEGVAAEAGVRPFRYVATNGVMSEDKAAWLARRFDLIGLSCDGPPDLQDRQRPAHDGRRTSAIVERTARLLREEGRPFHARTTVTRAGLSRLAEIAEYLCQQLKPSEIHLEPVYVGGRTTRQDALWAEDAEPCLRGYLAAREVARRHGIPLLTSGSRPGTLHGPYCQIFREVLNLVPGGLATACFRVSVAAEVERRGLAVGSLDRQTGRFRLDESQMAALRERLTIVPAACSVCFNRYHCTWGCPDRCPLEQVTVEARTCSAEGAAEDGHAFLEGAGGFRCRFQKAVALAALEETAGRLRRQLESSGLEEICGSALP